MSTSGSEWSHVPEPHSGKDGVDVVKGERISFEDRGVAFKPVAGNKIRYLLLGGWVYGGRGHGVINLLTSLCGERERCDQKKHERKKEQARESE